MSTPISVFDPTAPFRTEGLQQRIMPAALAGKTVGFIDNTKPNFSLIADDMAEILQKEHGVATIVRHRKRVASVPAPEAALADVVAKCDLVITGSGD
jgi:hypothetical protein